MTNQRLYNKLNTALAKPMARNGDAPSVDEFDPWHDIIQGINGSYSSESDKLMIQALEAVRDGATFDYIRRVGFIGEFMLYVLSGHNLVEYGTSPHGAWVDHDIKDLWQPLIDKWKAHYKSQWDEAYEHAL